MVLFENPLAIVAFFVMLLIHLAALIKMPKVAGKILNFLNLLIHASYVMLLAYYKISIEEGTLLYMISLLVYLAANLVGNRLYPSLNEAPSNKEIGLEENREDRT
jgi:hypothetical protein